MLYSLGGGDVLVRAREEFDQFRGNARFDPQGTPEDPYAITTSGYLGFERLADAVPEDYVPLGATSADA